MTIDEDAINEGEHRFGITSRTNRRRFMGLLGAGAAASQAGIGTVGAQNRSSQSQDAAVSDASETYIQLDSDVPGVLYEPVEETEKSHVAFVIMHPYADFTRHFGTNLVYRGYRVLGTSSHVTWSSHGMRGYAHMHDILPDLNKAVNYVRNLDGVDTVILFAHSAAGQLITLYQNVAENGIEIGQDDEKIYPLPDYLGEESFPEADGVLLFDCHTGDAAKGLIDLGPQVVSEENPQRRRPTVDMLNPENGYNPEEGEPSEYDEGFLECFFRGQADRMNSLIRENERRLQAIENFPESNARFPDKDQFNLIDHRSRVFRPDPSILGHTQEQWPLFHAEDSEVADETVTEVQVESVRGVREPDYTLPMEFEEAVEPQTVPRFLSTRAIRPTDDYQLTESSIEGINWNSSNATTAGNLETISSPLLILSATGHYFVVQSELYWNHAKSSDKTLGYIEGASHGASPIDPKYGDTEETTLEQIDQWTSARFI